MRFLRLAVFAPFISGVRGSPGFIFEFIQCCGNDALAFSYIPLLRLSMLAPLITDPWNDWYMYGSILPTESYLKLGDMVA